MKRIKVLLKLSVPFEDFIYDSDTMLFSAFGVKEAEIQAMIKEMTEDSAQ